MSLEIYHHKRDFTKTPEPEGTPTDKFANPSKLRFVVQEHHARSLHYDFRLEMDGVLKSWAVPKGPPATTKVRRLAVQTEDHPLSYIDFKGEIPDGNYGAGSVSIWDSGTYTVFGERTPSEDIDRGKIELLLQGNKLDGKYDLIRTDDERNEWIFIKSSHQELVSRSGSTHIIEARELSLARQTPMPDPLDTECMLSVSRDKPFSDPNWHFEVKWDGYRALLFAKPTHSQLFSRNKKLLNESFPELVNLSKWLIQSPAVIDGEIVALTPDGKPDFQALQNRSGFGQAKSRNRRSSHSDATIFYMAFDLLYWDGKDLTDAPLWQRRSLLKEIIKPDGPLRFSEHIVGSGMALYEQIQSLGLEGMMAKRAESPYVHHRSEDWIKIKSRKTIDAVIAGYTDSTSASRSFASLLIGAYSGDRLVSLGHVGTGYSAATMGELLSVMQKIEVENSPFNAEIHTNGQPHWVKPTLVCELKYAEITADSQLRQPVFVRLRPDKSAIDCMLERSNPEEKVMQIKLAPSGLAIDDNVDNIVVDVDHQRISLTHLNKIFWPASGDTKRSLLRYYASVADAIIPHLRGRPLVIQRYPDGVTGANFFQHDSGDHLPKYIETKSIVEQNGPVRYALCDTEASLLYFANLGAIPFHVWNGRMPHPETPDRVIFDLDPGGEFDQVIDVALALRKLLAGVGLLAFPKTSGASGLHVYVPIRPVLDSESIVGFARKVGEIMVTQFPDSVTTQRAVKNRKRSQVYLDCLQNGAGKTVVAAYSVRAQPIPSVSTPLSWEEVTHSLDPKEFTIDTVPQRFAKLGDLFGPVNDTQQELHEAIERLAQQFPNERKA
jgi:bifunctional non-homologous end joining protein LigD